MTIKKLGAKLAETDKEVSKTNQYLHSIAQGRSMPFSLVECYECKDRNLIHFPEPVTMCGRENDNKVQLDVRPAG
jgi:hypothetical protein